VKKKDDDTIKTKFDINPFFWVIIIFCIVIGYIDEFLLAYLSMFLHELGHITAALLLKKRVKKIKLLLIGLNASIDMDDCSWKERTIIFISGPFINLLMVIIISTIQIYFNLILEKMDFLILINIYLLLFNLLPIVPLDGGEILKDLLTNKLGLFLGSRYLRRISYCLGSVLVILGLIQMAHNSYNFSLIIIGIYIFINLKIGYLEAAFMNIKHITCRRARLCKRGIYAARDLVAIKSIRLGDIIKSLDYDRFHFIYVLDENLHLLRVFTEQELVDGMIKFNTEITLGELIERSI
jgi:stage IV sporulation protein FB